MRDESMEHLVDFVGAMRVARSGGMVRAKVVESGNGMRVEYDVTARTPEGSFELVTDGFTMTYFPAEAFLVAAEGQDRRPNPVPSRANPSNSARRHIDASLRLSAERSRLRCALRGRHGLARAAAVRRCALAKRREGARRTVLCGEPGRRARSARAVRGQGRRSAPPDLRRHRADAAEARRGRCTRRRHPQAGRRRQ